MARITEFEIVNHGYEHAQYFQGCGVSFTRFSEIVTGVGDDAVEAYRNAVEQIWNSGVDADALPERPRGMGITRRNVVPASHRDEGSECYWYVSIRWNESEV